MTLWRRRRAASNTAAAEEKGSLYAGAVIAL